MTSRENTMEKKKGMTEFEELIPASWTAEEQEAFRQWLHDGKNEELFKEWCSSSDIQKELIVLRYLDSRREKNLRRFIHALEHSPHKRVRHWMKWAAAASILLLLSVGAYWYVSVIRSGEDYIAADYELPSLVIQPSQSYKLDNRVNNIEYQGVKIEMKSGRVAYTQMDKRAAGIADSLLFNELVVPRGQMCEVKLVDGTVVKLNSDSRLRFPVSFKDSVARTVYLDGEGYFDVMSDPDQPFLVKAPHLEVHVYGTKFDIKSYKNDAVGRVMLEEGTMNVIGKDRRVKTMFPGDYSVYNGRGLVSSQSDVDADDVTCWQDYRFVFNNERLMDIALDLERKYDVEIYFDSHEASLLTFYSRTRRCEHVETVLDLLRLTQKIDYRISGRDIYIRLHE